MEEKILQLDCKKHVKIYLLSKLSKSNKEIADLVKTNQGHVWNVLNSYKTKPEKAELADKIIQ